MRPLHVLILAALIAPMAWAAPSESDAEEIEHLLSHLAISDCTFNRNGKWYSAIAAAKHLRSKYAYLLRKDLVTTAESFVELAATRSSVSGKPYLVRCGEAEPVESGAVMLKELERFRNMKRLTANKPVQPKCGSSLRRGRTPSLGLIECAS